MPALTMSIHIKGLDPAKARIEKIALGFRDEMGPALIEIGELGSKYFGGVAFQSKGSAFGKPWEGLAASTRADKAKHWPGRADMVRTGQMMNSFTYEVKGSASVRLFNSDPKFEFHQSAAERHKLPRRVMIGVNNTFEAIAVSAVRKQVKVIIEGSKL